MIRQFLSATLSAVAERVAPPPKVHPWPFALGATFTVLGALWFWILNEEAGLARNVAKTERDITKKRLDAIEADRFELRGRCEMVRARVATLENARLERAWEAAYAQAEGQAARDPRHAPGCPRAGDPCGTEQWPQHNQIRLSDVGTMGTREDRAVRVVALQGRDEGLYSVHVARGAPLAESDVHTAQQIVRQWPLVVDLAELTAPEKARCGYPSRVPHDPHADHIHREACPTNACGVPHHLAGDVGSVDAVEHG